MARNFDGTNDNIGFGADASIAGFTVKTWAAWVRHGATGVQDLIARKTGAATGWNSFTRTAADDTVSITQQCATTDGSYRGSTALGTGWRHIAMVHDLTGTPPIDPVIYVDGAAETITVITTPVGASAVDLTADAFAVGETGAGAADFLGDLEAMSYDNTLWDAATVNRARWWGRPGGGLEVYHPLFTDKLTNEGTGTADGTASGTTVAASLIPMVRPGQAMLGFGVGW